MNIATETSFRKLLGFLERLEQSKIHYRLGHVRDSIMVEVAIPGERWEVEFFEDGHLEVERFRSSGEIGDERELDQLFNADKAE